MVNDALLFQLVQLHIIARMSALKSQFSKNMNKCIESAGIGS